MKNGEVVLMMQQLSFSPVENILTVLFAAAILGYLLYLLVRSLRNRQRGYHTVRHNQEQLSNGVILVYDIMEKKLR